jgi:hypothetical protein
MKGTKTMMIRVLDSKGDQIALSPQINSALDSLGLDDAKPDTEWQEISDKIMRVLEGDGFEVYKLQPEITYQETKKGKKIRTITLRYLA